MYILQKTLMGKHVILAWLSFCKIVTSLLAISISMAKWMWLNVAFYPVSTAIFACWKKKNTGMQEKAGSGDWVLG